MELRIFLKNYLDNIFKKETERPQALQERGCSAPVENWECSCYTTVIG